ncbi:MAG TPA: multicopper oxidase domain-containing protein [Terriglobales bacterium]
MSPHARRSFGRTCSWHDTDPLIVHSGKRYRMRFRNESGDTHPLHLHRHALRSQTSSANSSEALPRMSSW